MRKTATLPFRLSRGALAILAIIVALFPIFWLAYLATRTPVRALQFPPSIFTAPQWQVFGEVWSKSGFAGAFGNSIIITILGVLISLTIGIPASYKLSRIRNRSDGVIKMWLVAVYALPPFLFAIPLFALYQRIGLFDTYFGIALIDQILILPLTIWLLTSFFDAIPRDLDEAAIIDGASRFRVLRSIHLPLLRPGIATAAILAAIIVWNEMTLALTLTFTNAKPVSIVVASFHGYGSADWTKVAASSLIALAPTLILAIVAQRYIVKGLVSGAVK